MRYDLSQYHSKRESIKELDRLIEKGSLVEIKEIKKTRSNQTNRALHLFFTFISDELNELGIEFTYSGVRGTDISVPYTPETVKQYFWRPIQRHLFQKESTTELIHSEIDQIIMIINKFFAEKGVVIAFPSMESLINELK